MFLVGDRKNVCTAPFRDTEELHSQSAWKANVSCIFLYISVRMEEAFIWRGSE